jgi:hypothetical protein
VHNVLQKLDRVFAGTKRRVSDQQFKLFSNDLWADLGMQASWVSVVNLGRRPRVPSTGILAPKDNGSLLFPRMRSMESWIGRMAMGSPTVTLLFIAAPLYRRSAIFRCAASGSQAGDVVPDFALVFACRFVISFRLDPH